MSKKKSISESGSSKSRLNVAIQVNTVAKTKVIASEKSGNNTSNKTVKGASKDPKSVVVVAPIPELVQDTEAKRLGRTIAICNQKGGCGKTTTVINLGAALARRGYHVLVIDLDSQCNATWGLGIDPSEVEESVFDILVDPKQFTAEDIIIETPFANLHLAPGSIDLAEFESRVSSEIGRENRLKKAFSAVVSLYDFVLIDTPPSLGLLSVNALNFSKEVHIAMQAHPFAFDGLQLLLTTIENVREELNKTLQITGIVITMFDHRTKISKEIVDRIESLAGLKSLLYSSVIRQNVKLTESSQLRLPIISYDPSSSGAKDYLALCDEFLARNINELDTQKVFSNQTEAIVGN